MPPKKMAVVCFLEKNGNDAVTPYIYLKAVYIYVRSLQSLAENTNLF